MSKVYNLNQLEELAGGSQEFVMSMVETFLEHTPQQLQELVDAYERKDLQFMGSIAHKIKPNIDLFGLSSIHHEIRQIEKFGKEQTDAPELPQLVEKVDETLNLAFNQMRAKV